jgi:hypothetical protein
VKDAWVSPQPFNGKPQALPPDFVYACGSPLSENDKHD